MASVQEPEVQFAQRLASNEKPTRTKAIKKLRKYINVRSQKATGGFTSDELLKLWKGLFYCLWMQDKPLLQEELSRKISGLIHSFHDADGQFMYLQSFLQTFKREWTGIDRLRMDKFFQLVRFMFRQTFEILKRKDWDSSLISRFLELLTSQLLQSGSDAPSGLQFHVLDVYMTELAAVGTEELTADQNLIFIEPFCKTAAKTKDRTLFGAICSSIFSTIIDQAPFAIDDLMKELKAAEASDSDSGQASEEEEEEEQQKTSKSTGGTGTEKQINGNKCNDEEEEEEEDEEEEDDIDDEDDVDELLHLEDSDTEAPTDNDVGPVLQFDYAALADKLLEFASRSSTPSQNRQRLYKIIKVLRDLSEGVFPQDEYPEEVSTDEDDDMFGSRRRMKRLKRRGDMEEEGEEGEPATKKSKGKKKDALKQNKDCAQDVHEPADLTANTENKKKKRKRKKKKKKAGQGGVDAEKSEKEQMEAQSSTKETEDPQKEESSSVKVTTAENEVVSEVKKPPSVTVTEEETSQQTPCTTESREQPDKLAKQMKTSEVKPAEEQTEASSDVHAAAAGKKKKQKKSLKLQTQENVAEVEVRAEEEDAAAPAKKKKKVQRVEKSLEEVEVNGVGTEEGLEKTSDSAAPAKKKGKKKNLKAGEAAKVEAADEEASTEASDVPLKQKTKQEEEPTSEAPPAADQSTVTPLRKKKRIQKEEETAAAGVEETPQVVVVDAETAAIAMTTSAKKKKKKKKAAAQVDEIKDEVQVVGSEDADETPQEVSSGKTDKKKKRKIPVTFEYEADELEATATMNGLAGEETAVKKTRLDAEGPSTPLSAKKSQKKKAKTPSGSDFITFQSKAAVPTPLFCRTKGSPGSPLSSTKKIQTPKSESKKVTFGLKNNKTAEFRKTDRSLLVSPDGSSRVPFDPKQKPKFGVLKSPATPRAARVKKTPKSTKKSSSGSPKSTPKRRPTASDFF